MTLPRPTGSATPRRDRQREDRRALFPGQDPIGRHITLTMINKEPAEIVGVVREVKLGSLDDSAANSETAVYAPAAQFAYGGSTLVVRTAGEPASLTRSVINTVHAIDPEQPVLNIQTMDEVVEESLGQRPLAMLLLAAFASLALVLATVGVYSVLAYTVRQRVREIGIRLALGAPVKGLLGMIVVEGLKPTLIGVGLGLVMAAALVRVLATLLFGVSQYDPRTFSVVALLMLAVGIVATLVPAYRATPRRSDRDATLGVKLRGAILPSVAPDPRRSRWRLRNHRRDRRRRNGSGLSGDRHDARPRCGDQDPARCIRRRSRTVGAIRA